VKSNLHRYQISLKKGGWRAELDSPRQCLLQKENLDLMLWLLFWINSGCVIRKLRKIVMLAQVKQTRYLSKSRYMSK